MEVDYKPIMSYMPSFQTALSFTSNPKLWFAQLEGFFKVHGVVDQTQRFYALISCIDGNVLRPVEHLVYNPTTAAPYDELKAALMDKYTVSRAQEVDQLLRACARETALPSERLARMRQIAGPEQANTEIFRRLWWTALPQHLRVMLAAVQDVPLDALASSADAIIRERDSSEPSIALIASRSRSGSRNFQPATRRHSSKRDPSVHAKVAFRKPHADQKPAPVGKKPGRPSGWCWYHRKFGSSSSKCRPPCTFDSENPTTSK
jgi:hypothetical protein